MITVLENTCIFDGHSEDLLGDHHIVIEEGRIREVTSSRPAFAEARVIDCGGRYVMPGLIDAHFHAYTPSFDVWGNDHMPPALISSHAAKILEDCLLRGFTTVRDAAGGDIGLRMAIEQGLIKGPRFFFSGKAISQTGGHGDFRPGNQVDLCACESYSGSISVVADGVDEMRKTVREQLRKGATQIKLFVSGGVVSPTDPLWMPQFTEEEIRAAVYEASTRRTYVMAHCHTDEGARRCAEYGVRSIEHGTMITPQGAEFVAQKGAYVVPTLSVAHVLLENGRRVGLPDMAIGKVRGVYEQMLQAVENCMGAGVRLGLGADLLGHEFHGMQGGELALRGEVNKPIDVLRSATSINAEILQQPDELGCIKPGAFADILILDANPLEDLHQFKNPEKNIPSIIKGGELIKNDL